MATFKQRKSGWWQAVVRRKGYPPQSQTFGKLADAHAWARDIENKIDRRVFVATAEAERQTFDDVARTFTTDFAPHHYRGKAWKFKLAQLTSKLGSYSLAAITPQVVSKYRDDRLKEPDRRYREPTTRTARVSAATVKGELDLLSKVLDVASKEFGITLPVGNPVLNIRKPAGAKSRDRRLNGDEMATLRRQCQVSGNPWLAPAMVLAIETAMRQGELLSLEWKHVDKNRKLAMLPNPDQIKTGEPRAVPLSSAALAALEGLPKSIDDRVIPIARMTLYHAFTRACKRAGVEDFTWHDLRHEALSRLAERGDFSVLEMAAVSGHKTLQMLKRYTHLQAEKLAAKLG